MEKKFLIIGKGSIGHRHFELIKQHNTKSHTLHVSSREFLRNSNNILKKNFTFIVIAGPVVHRENTLMRICNDPSFILVEKPIFGSLKNQNIIHNINNIWVGYNLRFNPLVQRVKKFISSHRSPPIKANFVCHSDARIWRSGDYLKRVSFNPRLGGGCLNELSHEIDLMFFLFGHHNYSIIKNNHKFEDHGLGKIDTYVAFSMAMENLKCDFNLDITSKINQRFFEIYFQDGKYIKCDIMHSKITGCIELEEEFSNNLPYIKQFIYCESTNFKSNVRDSLKIVQIIEELRYC
jgi:predicted dehydrogenase